ncbi:MAG: chemotaxis-specific protein-glutamate methyltransferase CheB [Isosphaeraceae bacterium]
MSSDPLKVLIVDDSRIFRSALEEALRGNPGVRVVGSVWNGDKAIEFVRATPPDLVTLDINMPGRGGLETLSDIRQLNTSRPELPPVGVILVSALTDRGAAITVEGLSRGAFDFIRKPDGPDEKANAATLQRELNEKIALFAQRRLRTPAAIVPARQASPVPTPPTGRYQAVVIGASTGGPEALATVLPELTRRASVPIFIVNHFPVGIMTRFFAESLARRCPYSVIEAADGAITEPRTAYIAPSGRHMVVRRQGPRIVIGLNDLPPENGFRPSVDVLFRSVAEAYPRQAIGIVLTGMGNDGAKGLGPLKRSGAYLIAQDEASSVVWGMPKEAVATNLVDQVLPLTQIGPAVATLLADGGTP